MPTRLDSRDPAFETAFAAFLATKREGAQEVDEVVRTVIADVVARGDEAVIDYTARFDRVTLAADRLRVTEAEIDQAVGRSSEAARAALSFAAERITAFHNRQRPSDLRFTDETG